MLRRVTWGLALVAGAAPAMAITLADLQGVTIYTTNTYTGQMANDLGSGRGDVTIRGEITIGPGDAIRHSFQRSVIAHGPKGTKQGSISRSNSGRLSVPMKSSNTPGGAGLWLLQGDTLIALKTVYVGGGSMRITLRKAGNSITCSVTASLMRELGKGATTLDAALAGAGKAKILQATPTGSSCRTNRN
jgi:hypothetical protein